MYLLYGHSGWNGSKSLKKVLKTAIFSIFQKYQICDSQLYYEGGLGREKNFYPGVNIVKRHLSTKKLRISWIAFLCSWFSKGGKNDEKIIFNFFRRILKLIFWVYDFKIHIFNGQKWVSGPQKWSGTNFQVNFPIFEQKKHFFCADRPILGKFAIYFSNAQIFATPSTKTMINRERHWFRGWNFGEILTTYSSWYSVKMGLFYFLGALCENPIWNNP